MRVAVVAIGTELLLGQIVDTNSATIGRALAERGISSHLQIKVGDNHGRIVAALRQALEEADAVITCGGLGPTQDDITREAVAEVAGRPLLLDGAVATRIEQLFAGRGLRMPENNYRQAMVPEGAAVITQRKGTAPGLIVPAGGKVICALPGVPYELEDMLPEVLAVLVRRSGEEWVIRSRIVRTWGLGESRLAEMVAPRLEAVEGSSVTLAFLASGIEGIKVRVTVRARSDAEAAGYLDREEERLRAILGDYVFGIDDVSLEIRLAGLLEARGLHLAVAESLTGGMLASRLVGVPGASSWFRGGVISYATEVKRDLIGVTAASVVSEEAAAQMALGAARVLGAEVGIATTGVAGPESMERRDRGVVCIGVAVGGAVGAREVKLLGDRERVRAYATATAIDLARLTLEGSSRGIVLGGVSAGS